MAEPRQFRQDQQIIHGTTAQTNAKLTDIMPLQHEDLATQTNQMKKISLGQCLCEPFAVCNSNNPANGAYVADCVNFPDFTLQFTDEQGNNHSLIGLKVRVLFNYGITYGSVSGGTYPTLNINGSGAIPLLAQGKTMGTGAISAGQTVEFTIIPYGNSLAFDADSNVREANSDYTVYTDGSTTYTKKVVDDKTFGVPYVSGINYDNILGRDLNNYKYPLLTFVNNSGQYSNCPIGAFILVVIGTDNMGEKDDFPYIRQFLMSYANSGNIKTRVFEPNQQQWTSWSNFSFS